MTTSKKKQQTSSVVDVDAMIAEETTASPSVTLLFRGTEWTFKGITEAPLHLFDGSLEEAESAVFFLKTMLDDDQPPLPDDVTLRDATALVNAYSKTATGLSAGE